MLTESLTGTQITVQETAHHPGVNTQLCKSLHPLPQHSRKVMWLQAGSDWGWNWPLEEVSHIYTTLLWQSHAAAHGPGLERAKHSARFSDQLCASDIMAVICGNRGKGKTQTHKAFSSSVCDTCPSPKEVQGYSSLPTRYPYEITTTTAYPWATEASQAGCSAVVTIINFHVVVPTVSLLLDVKYLEYQLHPIAIFSYNHPVTVGLTWIVVVPKLSMGI